MKSNFTSDFEDCKAVPVSGSAVDVDSAAKTACREGSRVRRGWGRGSSEVFVGVNSGRTASGEGTGVDAVRRGENGLFQREGVFLRDSCSGDKTSDTRSAGDPFRPVSIRGSGTTSKGSSSEE